MLRFVAIIFAFLIVAAECSRRRRDTCEHVPLDCGLQGLEILFSLANFPTEEFLNEHCSLLVEELGCHKNFVDRCAEKMDSLNYFTIYEGMLTLFIDACEQNSALRREYLQNLACYRNTTVKLNACAIDIQSRIDLFEEWEEKTAISRNIEKRKYGCIGGPLRRRCFTVVILKECGEEGAELFARIARTISQRITDLLCPGEMVDLWNAEFFAFVEDRALDLPFK